MEPENDLELINQLRACRESDAQEKLIKKYLPMVKYIVKKQNVPPFDFEDYFQEGMIGLLKAITEYDPENYSNKFSTFAYICILRRIFNIKKQAYHKKQYPFQSNFLLNMAFPDDTYNPLDLIPDYSMEPYMQIEEKLVREKLGAILKVYLSPVEYYVIWMVIADYHINEIRQILDLPVKVIDNARTRARLKLKKVLHIYGSFLNPQIPMQARKRKDRAIQVI